nr:outer membrane beta-barrel family protein [Treponemataceae bacterium]
SNPSYIRTGNPDLKEQITHFTSLSFSPKLPAQWISLTLSGNYYYTKNLINSIVQAQNDGVMVQSYFNFGHANTYDGQADISINFNKKLYSGTSFRYTNSYTRLPSGARNNTRSFSIRQSLAWTPRFFDLETHFFYDPRAISAQTAKVHMDPKLSVYLSRYFQKQHIGISIKADDLLRSGGSRETLLKDEGFTQRVLTESLGRTLQISVYWRFGAFSNSEKVNVSAYDME